MITRGTPKMIPALSRIWEACFGDSPDYIRFFMERRFPTCRSFVWLEGEEPVGAIYLLPCSLEGRPVLYAYAGGVLPRCREQGGFSALLDRSDQACREIGASLILVPASGTEAFYQRRGFQTAFSFRQLELGGAGEVIPAAFREAEAGLYTALRDRGFARRPYLRWGMEAVEYALAENRFCGGFGEIMTLDRREFLLFGKREGDTAELLETTLDEETARLAAPALCRRWGVEKIRVRLPAEREAPGSPGGSILGQAAFHDGWLGLGLL